MMNHYLPHTRADIALTIMSAAVELVLLRRYVLKRWFRA